MSVAILRGDARSLPLPDESVDLIATSPPFWQLRSYTDGGQHYAGQIGSEPAWQEYIASLLACTAEWMRVLKPSGSLFVELGDKYSDRGHGPNRGNGTGRGLQGTLLRQTRGPLEKCLLDLPHRYAIRCVDDLGLIKRAEIIWHHVNGLPESMNDRVRRVHSVVFHLVKQPRYYAAVDEIRESHAPQSIARTGRRYLAGDSFSVSTPNTLDPAQFCNPLGKLPGSVWSIPSAPLTVPAHLGIDHFAAFPPALVRPIVLGWSPAGICVRCGEGRRPVPSVVNVEDRKGRKQRIIDYSLDAAHGPDGRGGERWRQTVRITGYTCACPTPGAPTRPAVVLDPFAGTGTTMLVASAYGRIGIGVDRSADYCRLARWRTTDPGERARALGVPKPPPVADGQMDLFGAGGAA